jgi:hypothetical protein
MLYQKWFSISTKEPLSLMKEQQAISIERKVPWVLVSCLEKLFQPSSYPLVTRRNRKVIFRLTKVKSNEAKRKTAQKELVEKSSLTNLVEKSSLANLQDPHNIVFLLDALS